MSEIRLADGPYLALRAAIAPGMPVDRASFLLLSSLRAEQAAFRSLRQTLIGVGLMILAAALGIGFALARGITRPIATLARAARRIGAGDLDTRVDVTTGDELEQLGASFNRMVAGLRERDLASAAASSDTSRGKWSPSCCGIPEALAPRGARRTVSVLFSDLEGFTSLCRTARARGSAGVPERVFRGAVRRRARCGRHRERTAGRRRARLLRRADRAPRHHAARACRAALGSPRNA